MNLSNWITLTIFGITQISLLITAYWRIRIKMTEIEMKIKEQDKQVEYIRSSLHLHEAQNEKVFDRFDKKIDGVYTAINEIKTILINKNFN